MDETPKRRLGLPGAVFACCVLAGAMVWAGEVCLNGPVGPVGRFYIPCLFAAGFVAGAVSPRSWWTCWAGIYLGQVICYIFTPVARPSAFWVLGIPILFFFSLFSLAGAGIGAILRIVSSRMSTSRPLS